MVETAVILAGGKSARFGKPKGLAIIDGKTVLERMIAQIHETGIEKIYLSTNDPETFSSLNLDCIPDEYKDSGPLAGIHSALKTTDADSILFLSCDLPMISCREIKKIIDASIDTTTGFVYAATPTREHPLCSVIKKQLLSEITTALDNHELSVLDFLHGIDNKIVYFEDEDPFLNLNTPDELILDERIISDLDLTIDHPIVRFHRSDGLKEMDDAVVRESFVRLWLNDDEIAVIHALKRDVEDLALGFLYTECLINNITDIESIEYNDKLDAVTVITREEIPRAHSSLVRTVAPGCGQVHFSIRPTYADYFNFVESDFKVKADKILELMTALLRSSTLFKTTGGVHTAAISDCEKLIHVTDDIGRHNCVDKIIGRELRKSEIQPVKRMILTSGRISTDILTKCLRGKIPFLVSHSAPSEGALQLADKYGITLVGFVRGARYNIYTHSERIEL